MLRQAEVVERLADTYFSRDDSQSLTNDLPVYMENWFAAGAMVSTADDLLKFADALFAGALLQPDSRERMLTPGLDDYGYGLWIDTVPAGGKMVRVYRRPGQIMGAQTMLIRYHELDLTIVVLGNASNTSPDEFAFAIGRRFL
ncbi:serine hydrolase [Nannocystis sp. ILAH1]|uniref:serine hydrolase n=1 Tax=Nannocystis sp. ILAH1 TaxID=2996789 RepID=UPI00320A288A